MKKSLYSRFTVNADGTLKMREPVKGTEIRAILLMAKIQWGALVVDGSGKLGGHVFTRNRQGSAMRTRSIPINRRSTTQITQRSEFTTLSQNWRNLTNPQRTAWNNAAQDFTKSTSLAKKYHSTGKNYYFTVNANILLTGGTVITSPPVETSPAGILTVVIATATAAALSVTYTPTPVATANAYLIEATRGISPGIGSPGKTFRKITVLSAAAASPYDAFSKYVIVFGTPIVGKNIWVRITPIETVSGIRGLPVEAFLIVS
jgi:hypothetical protein